MLTFIQDPEVIAQAGSHVGNQTQTHPVGLAALGILAAMVLLAPRQWVSLPVVLLLCFIPAGQRIVLGGIDFTFLRILMCVVWLRMFLRSEARPIVWNHLDRVMVLYMAVCVVTGTLRDLSVSTLINRLGGGVDAAMIYFFFRLLIRNHRDLALLATAFLVSSFAVFVCFVIENRTGRNMFAVMGGVPEITDVRDGRLRCQGSFDHSILAGCFWACLIPIYLVRGWTGFGWRLAAVGAVIAVGLVGLSSSSTPVMALIFCMLGHSLFLMRGLVRWLRWMALLVAAAAQTVMNMPIWHLVARIDVVGGSTGFHRFNLMDQFAKRIPEWGMLGTPSTGHWGYGLHDVTNQYVAEGIGGGLTRLALFFTAIVLAFVGVSRSMRLRPGGQNYKLITWALGTVMFMHCMNFIGISYFGQIVAVWFMSLAAVSSLTLVPGAPIERQLAELADWQR